MAHVTVDRDNQTDILRFRVTGFAEIGDFVPHITAEYPKHPGVPVLWDFSNGLFSCASVDDLRTLSRITGELGRFREDARTAIVLRHKADAAQMKFYVELSKMTLPSTRYAIFGDCEQAVHWLLAKTDFGHRTAPALASA